MKAIITKYHGPSNVKGSRISARAEGCPTRYYDYDDSARSAHLEAAQAYRNERGWSGAMVGGGLPDGRWAWCFVQNQDRGTIPARA